MGLAAVFVVRALSGPLRFGSPSLCRLGPGPAVRLWLLGLRSRRVQRGRLRMSAPMLGAALCKPTPLIDPIR
jgi:hypothetical protein